MTTQVAQRSWECCIPGDFRGQVGWPSGWQPGPWQGIGTGWALSSLPTQAIRWFCVSLRITFWPQPYVQQRGPEFWLLKPSASINDPFRNGGIDHLNKNLKIRTVPYLLEYLIPYVLFCSHRFTLCATNVLMEHGKSGHGRGSWSSWSIGQALEMAWGIFRSWNKHSMGKLWPGNVFLILFENFRKPLPCLFYHRKWKMVCFTNCSTNNDKMCYIQSDILRESTVLFSKATVREV